MRDEKNKRSIDLLIDEFWKLGYLTTSRKYGSYLPEPPKVGGYEVDAIARQNKNYAIGITLNERDFADPKLLQKISFLASRQTKKSNRKVILVAGLPQSKFKFAKELLEYLPAEAKSNIKLFPIPNEPLKKPSGIGVAYKSMVFA